MHASASDSPQAETAMPSGEFKLKPAWRRLLSPQRGRPANRKPPTLDALIARLAHLPESTRWYSNRIRQEPLLEALLERHPLAELYSPHTLQRADPEHWRVALLLSHFFALQRDQPHPGQTLVQACVHWHGVVFACDSYFRSLRQFGDWDLGWYLFDGTPGCIELCAALADCATADYAAAREQALGVPPAHDVERFARAAVFNTEEDLVEDAMRVLKVDSDDGRNEPPGLIGARLSLEQGLRIVRSPCRRSFEHAAQPLALNLLDLHGEPAVAVLAELFNRRLRPRENGRLAELLRAADSASAFGVLLDQIERKEVRPAIDSFAKDYPMTAMQVAASRIDGPAGKHVRAWLKQMQLAYGPQSAASKDVSVASDSAWTTSEAPLAELPAVLRDPPWLRKPSRARIPELPDITLPAPRMHWPDKLRPQWQATMPVAGNEHYEVRRQDLALRRLGIPEPLRAGLLSGDIVDLAPHLAAIKAEARGNSGFHRPVGELGFLSPSLRLLLWNTLPGFEHPAWDGGPASAAAMVAHYELAALPGLLTFIGNAPRAGLVAALPVEAAEIAASAANALKSKHARPAAIAWLSRYAELASTALLMQSSRGSAAAKAAAEAALRWLASRVDPARLKLGAQPFGAAGDARLQAILAIDPLPQKPRPLPGFYVPNGFRRPRLRDGRTLPAGALAALGTMLQVSRLDEPYAGLEQVTAACTAKSLDEFAWDLFHAWEQGNAPTGEAWAYHAIGLIGGDGCIRRLVPLLRQWPSEGRSARSQTALDILCAIGSDLALMHLDDIARTVKSRPLREHANDRLERIAEARGLCADDLADRLVPDLGLGSDGSLSLDFGTRCFTAGVDDHLRPFLRDANGARLKDLPVAAPGDDAARVQLSSERWKRLKKDSKAIAARQTLRLESLMCSGRRLEPDVFERFFVRHPLVGTLARRLLWGAVLSDGAIHAFRIAEDRSFADGEDRGFRLPPECSIRLLHPLEIDAQQRIAWSQIFSDYRILQPFPQLDREIVRMSDEELAHPVSTRFEGRHVATGSVLGLERSGWHPPADKESGHVGWFEKPLAHGTRAVIRLAPGIPVYASREHPVQTLGLLSLEVVGLEMPVEFQRIDPITRSELLRDLDRLPDAA